MIFDDNASELLKHGEAEQQKAIDSYSNYDLKSSSSAPSVPSTSENKLSQVAKQLRQDEEDDLRTGDVTEDDHGKKFVSDDDEFFEPPPEKKKSASIMEVKREILSKADEAYEEYSWYDGSTASMESYDEDFKESAFAAEEASYQEELNDYTYDASTMY